MNYLKKFSLLFFLISAFHCGLNIELPVFYQLTRIGSYPSTDKSYHVLKNTDYIYLSDGTGGLQILDVKTPSAPVLKGTIPVTGEALRSYISGNIVYISSGTSGNSYVADITNPAAWSALWFLWHNMTGPPYPLVSDTAVSGTFVFTAFGDSPSNSGIAVWETATGLSVVSATTTQPIKRVVIENNIAYLAASSDGLRIIDISDPTWPVQLSVTGNLGTITDIALYANYAFLSAGSDGIKILNISNPAAPVLVGSYTPSGPVKGLFILGSELFISMGTSGLEMVNITVPSSPHKDNKINDGYNWNNIYVEGNTVYAAQDTDGLGIYRF